MVTARSTPVGTMLENGFVCKIACSQDPDISFWEKTIKPPSLDGGAAIETSTQWNSVMRTMGFRALITAGPSNLKVAYDPVVYDQIRAIMNVNCAWTLHWPNGATHTFYGALTLFDPAELVPGTFPEASVVITPS